VAVRMHTAGGHGQHYNHVFQRRNPTADANNTRSIRYDRHFIFAHSGAVLLFFYHQSQQSSFLYLSIHQQRPDSRFWYSRVFTEFSETQSQMVLVAPSTGCIGRRLVLSHIEPPVSVSE
jgi:hypothetical protein